MFLEGKKRRRNSPLFRYKIESAKEAAGRPQRQRRRLGGGWRGGWRTMNFSGYIDCMCTTEPTPADTFWSAAALDTRSQTTRLLRPSAMPTKERGPCVGGTRMVEGYASTCGETRSFSKSTAVECGSTRESGSEREEERKEESKEESCLFYIFSHPSSLILRETSSWFQQQRRGEFEKQRKF